MKPVFHIDPKKFWIQLRKKLDRNLLIFLFFLVLSGLFWLLNELNQEFISDISYPVRYTNLAGNKILVNEMPSRLEIKLQGPGYTLMKYKLSPRFLPLNLDMRSYFLRRKRGTSSDEQYLLTKDLQSRFERRLDGDINILEILPDTLFFKFDSIVYRKVPVIPDVNYTLARQYMLREDIQSVPDSVQVSGPGMILDTLSGVYTVYESFELLNKSVQKEIRLRKLSKVTNDIEEVVVSIPVEQYTEAQLSIPINAVNVPDTLNLITFPNQIQLSCVAGLSNFDKLSELLFRAEVDYDGIDQNMGGKLKVELAMVPEFVRSVKIHPLYVEFVIEKK